MPISCARCGVSSAPDRQFCSQCGAALSWPCQDCGTTLLAGDRYCGGCGVKLAEPTAAVPEPSATAAAELCRDGRAETRADAPAVPGEAAPPAAEGGDGPAAAAEGEAGRAVEQALNERALALLETGAAALGEGAQEGAGEGPQVLAAPATGSGPAPAVPHDSEPTPPPSTRGVLLSLSIESLDGRADCGERAAALARFAQHGDHRVAAAGGVQIDAPAAEQRWLFSDPDPVLNRERAASAALALHTALEQFNFQDGASHQLRVAVVEAAGQCTWPGELVPAAAALALGERVLQLTPPGAIYLAGDARETCGEAVQVELVGQVNSGEANEAFAVYRLMSDAAGPPVPPQQSRPLLGRERELEQLLALIDGVATAGSGRWLLLSGAPGIGKSSLLAQLRERAQCAAASCYQHALGARHLAPGPCLLHALAEQWAQARHPGLAAEQVRELLQRELLLDSRGESLLGALFGTTGAVALDENAQVGACAALLARVLRHGEPADRPSVLIVDDWHWASPADRLRLSVLCDCLSEQPVAVVVASREHADESHLAALLETRLAGQSLRLEGLEQSAAYALAAHYLPVDTPVVGQCVARAGGNPLYLCQQLQAAIDSIDASGPASLRSIVLSRLAQIGDEARDQLQAAAVLGRRFGLGTWSGLLGSLPSSCEELLRRDLIRRDEGGYHFAHDLIHSVIYRAMSEAQRREWHRRAAGFFEHQSELSAWHLVAAGAAGQGVGTVLSAAALALDRGEWARAGQLLEALAAAQLPAPQASRRHHLLGLLERRRGELDSALAHFERARTQAEPWCDRSELELETIRCRIQLGDRERALQEIGELLAQARAHAQPALECRALLIRAQLLDRAARLAEAESDLSAARELLARVDDTALAIEVRRAAGELLLRAGRVREAEQQLGEAHRQHEALQPGRGWSGRDPLLAQCLYFLGETPRARTVLDAAVAHARQRADAGAQLAAMVLLCPVLSDLGESGAALSTARQAIAIADERADEAAAGLAMVAAGEAQIRLGKLAPGLQLLTRAWRRVEAGEGRLSAGPRALAALAAGVQREGEQRNLLAKGEHLLNSGADGLDHLYFYRTALQVALAADDRQLARRYRQLLQLRDGGQELPWVMRARGDDDALAPGLVAPLIAD